MRSAFTHVLVCLCGILALSASLIFVEPHDAQAVTLEELEAKADELGKKVDEAAQVYADAIANVETLDASIAENEAKLGDVETQIPLQREKSADAIKRLYKLSQNAHGIVELLLSAEDFNSFITTVTYLNAIETHNAKEANKLVALQNDLAQTQAELDAQRTEALNQQNAADQALKEAERLRQEAVELAAQKAEEEAARKAAEEEAARALASGDASALANAVHQSEPHDQPREPQNTPAQPSGGSEASPSQPKPSGDASRDEFVAEWAPRIDAYLSGSPLAGYGYAFAEAAYDYGVDPRWSPAISNTESSKGRVCFRSHNAWGWGQVSWPDWDTAIRAHVKGLSSGYGYTISEENAKKYCPPTWQAWYTATLAEMAKI